MMGSRWRSMSEQTNLRGDNPFVFGEFSYSTADIERSVFYGAEHAPLPQGSPVGAAKYIVVNSEMFLLEEDTSPPAWQAFTRESGLFGLFQPPAAP
jgi:hypothetical protein